MASITALSYALHSGMAWYQDRADRVLDSNGPLSVSLFELEALAVRFPIVFRKSTTGISPVIPLKNIQNGATPLVSDDGSWRPGFVPGALRRGPFTTVRHESKRVVAVNQSALVPRDEGPGATPLFDETGLVHADTKVMIDSVSAWDEGCHSARIAARALSGAGVLKKWPSDESLLIIDPKRLAKLEPEQAGQLHSVGALRLAHASQISLGLISSPHAPEAIRPRGTATPDSDFLSAVREQIG